MKAVGLAILLAFCVSGSFCQGRVFSDAHIDSAINAFKVKWGIPGISVAIAKDGRLVYAKGYGYADTSTREPVTVGSLFRIASCSKTITAIGVMKLIQEKRLGINDTVFGANGILNDQAYRTFADARIGRITVRNLLQQTIGWDKNDVVGGSDASFALKTPCPSQTGDVIRFNLQKSLDFAPATDYRYANFNYLVLGEIIKKVTGHSYEEYITSEVLHPIGVYTTQRGRTRLEDKLANEVHYYDYDTTLQPSIYDTTKFVLFSYGGFNMETMHANGGWVSRPIDMVKILLSIDGSAAQSDILNRETLQLMMTKPDGIKSDYAMGMETHEGKWYHTGALSWGSSAVIFRDSTGVCFAITCNTLGTRKGTDEQMFKALVEYATELFYLLPETLKSITSYPDINLFERYSQASPKRL